MRIAGHTLGTPEMPLTDALKLFHDAGLDAAEVVWQDDYQAGIAASDTGRELKAADRLQRESGVDIICLTPYMSGINSLDDDERARDIAMFRRCIDAAEQLSCGLVRAYAGSYLEADEDVREKKWDRLVESLRELGPLAESQGVTLCIENHFNTMAASAAETAGLLQAVDSEGIGVLYDQANLDFAHQEPFEQAFPLLRPWIRHVHVKDFVFTDPHAPFRSGAVTRVEESTRTVRSCVVGEGAMDWKTILGTLKHDGYEGFLSLEYEYRWHPNDLPPPSEGIPRSVEAVRSLLGSIDGKVT